MKKIIFSISLLCSLILFVIGKVNINTTQVLLSQNIEALSYIECYYDQYGIVVINTYTNEIKYDQRVKKGKRSCKLKYGKVCTLSIN